MRAEREKHRLTWQIPFLRCPGEGEKCLRGFSVYIGWSSFAHCAPKVEFWCEHISPSLRSSPAMQDSDLLSTREQDQKGWNSKGPSWAAARPSPMSEAGAAVLSPAGMWMTPGAPPTLPGSLTRGGVKNWRCLCAEVWNKRSPGRAALQTLPHVIPPGITVRGLHTHPNKLTIHFQSWHED